MIRHRSIPLIPIVATAIVAVNCAKAPPPPPPAPVQPALTIVAGAETPVKAQMTIAASADTNPDANGRPSPIVVRVYQLRTSDAFANADFFALFDDEEKVLGPARISSNEFLLAPKEQQTIAVAVAPETRFVGAIAAFRDIRNAQWRAIVPAPRSDLTLSVERARVVLTPLAK